MKRVFFVVFFILIGGPLQGWAISRDALVQHCPQADKYRLQRSFYFSNLKEVVRAPQSPEEVQARFAELVAVEKWRRQAAISSLALAGNIDLFKQLLAEGDSDGMTTYAGNYLRRDGNLCIDPQIEKAIVHHFHDPRFSRPFLSFFHKNLYAGRAFFETLTPLSFDPDNPDQYGRIVKALCATNLAGLEKQLLAIGMAALPHETPTQKRVMPGVHQSLIGYLGRQKAPAFSYFRAVLAMEPRSEEVVYFQKSYAQTRFSLYQALSNYPGDESFVILLEQLAELIREPWGPFYSNDLTQICTHIKVHTLFRAKTDEVLLLLAQILTTPSLPDQVGFIAPRETAGEPEFYDQQIRQQVYALLTEIDSEAAGVLLLDELAGLVQRPVNESNMLLLGSVHQALAALSRETFLDISRLIDLADQLPEQFQRFRLAEIISRHPQPEGYDFVMEQFEMSFPDREFGVERGGHPQATALFFDLLLQFSKPKYLLQTRAKIDALFMAERLVEERYRQMSTALEELLGEESPTYLALLEAKKEEKKERQRQELAAAQLRWRQEMADELVRQKSEEGVAANIKALSQFSGEAKTAAYWLIRVGKPVLPQVHAALGDPEANIEWKMQLMIVLAEIGDPSSTGPIIAAAKTEPANTMLLKDAFLSLARIPQTGEAIAFAKEWLEDVNSSSQQKISALAYFASHRDQQALVWSRKFSSSDRDPSLRAVALYLGAMLAEQEIKGQIVEMLAINKDRAIAHILWRGLAEITSYEEFKKVVDKVRPGETSELKQIEQYVRFRNSEGREKVKSAEKLLRFKTPLYSETAIDFLLGSKEFPILAGFFEKKEPYTMSLEMGLYVSSVAQRIFSEARRRGYRIEEKEGEIHFLPMH